MRTGDCVNEIIERYSSMVYRLAFSQTRSKSHADDVFQEVFLRYVRKHPDFSNEEHRKAWIIRVTINCCKKLLASAWFRRVVSSDGFKDLDIYGNFQENTPFETPEETNLHFALKKLPPKYRAVIHLFYYEEMSVAEIGGALNLKPSTVRTQLTRARSMLRENLEGV